MLFFSNRLWSMTSDNGKQIIARVSKVPQKSEPSETYPARNKTSARQHQRGKFLSRWYERTIFLPLSFDPLRIAQCFQLANSVNVWVAWFLWFQPLSLTLAFFNKNFPLFSLHSLIINFINYNQNISAITREKFLRDKLKLHSPYSCNIVCSFVIIVAVNKNSSDAVFLICRLKKIQFVI